MNSKAFNNMIADYEFARPGYPEALFEDILVFAKLSHGARLLEIGAGPGQATDYFVKHGYSVTSLEIGENQVHRLQMELTINGEDYQIVQLMNQIQNSLIAENSGNARSLGNYEKDRIKFKT